MNHRVFPLKHVLYAVVKNNDGVCTSASFAEQRSIGAGDTTTFNFNIKKESDSSVEIYIFNNETDYKLLCPPIEVGSGVMQYTAPSGTIFESHIIASDGGETININGTSQEMELHLLCLKR